MRSADVERLGIIMPDVEECLSRQENLTFFCSLERGRIEEYGTLTEFYFRSVCQGDDFALFVDGMFLEHGCQFYILELVVHLDVELAEYNQHQQRYEDGSQFGKVEDSKRFFLFYFSCFFCFEEAVVCSRNFFFFHIG